jgi:hypothetical protein
MLNLFIKDRGINKEAFGKSLIDRQLRSTRRVVSF